MEREEIIDIGKALLAIILLTVLNFYFPILSVFVLIIWPIPVVVTAVKHGMRIAVILITIAAVVNGILFSPLMGLITIVGFGFIGFTLGGSLNEDFSPLKTLIFTVLAAIISQAIIIFSANLIFGFNLNNFINEVVKYISQAREFSEFKEILQAQVQLIKRILPSMIAVSAILTGILNYYISLWYLNKRGFKKEVFLSIKLWRFPRLVSILLVISLFLKTNTIFLNINIILLFIIFIQGFAVGFYYIARSGHSLFLKWLYIFSILFIPVVPIVLMLTGLVDMWFNLRRLG